MAISSDDPADYTVLREGRLVAHVWGRAGTVARAGGRAEPLCTSSFIDVRSFDARAERDLLAAAGAAEDVHGFLFELKLEEYEVIDGHLAPHAKLRRF